MWVWADPKDVKKKEKFNCGYSFYVFFSSPRAHLVLTGLARRAVCFGLWTFLCSIFMGFSLFYLLANIILDFFPILTTKHCYKMFWLGNTQFTSVQLLSRVQLFPSPWTAARQASLSITNSQMSFQTHVHWVGDAIQPSHPLSSLMLLPSIFPSITVFSNESVFHIRWPKHWNFRISPSNKYSGLISFRIDWFDLSIQGTLKNLLQHHSSKASIVRCSAFFIPQLSHPYLTTGKAIALTRQIFVGKVMSLLLMCYLGWS